MKPIHAPFEPAGEGPFPALIALHGWGANALDLLGLGPYIAQGKFLLICPQGPLEVEIGVGIGGYGWFPISKSVSPPPESEVEAAVTDIEEFIDDAVGRYPVDKRKLVLLGFSQGGVMAVNLALRNLARYAALIDLSTWFPPQLLERDSDREALEQLPTLVQHGRADD